MHRLPCIAPLVRACSLTLWFTAAVPSASARAEELAAEVRDALAQNAAAALPLEVNWTLQRTSSLSLADLLALLQQPAATKLLTSQEFSFAIQGQKLHYSHHYKGGKKWELREVAFDTECFFESLGTTMHITGAKKRINESQGARVFGLDYLDAAGIFVPNTPATIGQPPQSLVLHLLAEGGTLERSTNETVQGVACLRIDITHRDRQLRFFLDPNLNYAVRRQEEWSGPQHVSTTVCDRFQKLKPPLQFPLLCRVDFFSYMNHSLPDSRRPVVTETISVTKLDQSPLPESTFVIEPEVGMIVADSRLPEAAEFDSGYTVYKRPARPEDLQQAIDKGTAELHTALASQKRGRWQLLSVTTGVAAGAVALLGGLAYLGVRWRAERD